MTHARTKRTYNLPERTVRRVRELADGGQVGSSQDAVVETAIERLYDQVRADEDARAGPRRPRIATSRPRWRRSPGSSTSPTDGPPERVFVRRPRSLGPLRWAIVLVDFDPTVGHEQRGTRRALVVSYESFHRSGMATVCPITTRPPKYPGEVPIPAGHAGQTKDGLILCHQLRTIDLARVSAFELEGGRSS